MPTPERERLSSRLTGTLQVAPMLAWIVFAYVLIWLILHQQIGVEGLAGDGMRQMLARLVLFFLLVPLILLPGIAWWASGLRRVATNGHDLLVTLASGRTASVKLTSVRDIAERRSADMHVVTVTFDTKTPAGRRIKFLAPTRFRVPRGEEHPLVKTLREAVAAAHSEAEHAPALAP